MELLRFLNDKLHELIFQATLLHYPVVAELEFGKSEISNTLSFRSASQAMPNELRRHFGEFLTELAPIFMIKSRGLSGLRKLLTVALDVPSVRLYECDVQKVVVPQSSRPSLGRDTFELGSSSSKISLTGKRASSPGASSCCSKQKHSNFFKCAAAFEGATLGTA